jgi:hypothetical protein
MSGGIVSTLHTMSDQLHALPVLPPREESPRSSGWTGGWIGPGASMDAVEKRELLSPCLKLNPDSSGYLVPCLVRELSRPRFYETSSNTCSAAAVHINLMMN